MSVPDVTVVVPAFDEERRIVGTIEELRAAIAGLGLAHQIVVVVDGTDGTRDLAEAMAASDPGIEVLARAQRAGKGRAVKDGLARARGAVVGFVDADGKTDARHVAEVVERLQGGEDLVVGTRASGDSRILVRPPLHRRLGSRAFALAVHALVGLHGIDDTQCGFKFLRDDVARTLVPQVVSDGYLLDVELLARAERQGLVIGQLPVRWSDDGDSRSPLVTGTVRHALELVRIRRRVRGMVPTAEA